MALATLLYLTNTNDELRSRLISVQEVKDAYQQVTLNCVNQALNGGNAAVIIDNKLFGIECQKLSDRAYEGVKL